MSSPAAPVQEPRGIWRGRENWKRTVISPSDPHQRGQRISPAFPAGNPSHSGRAAALGDTRLLSVMLHHPLVPALTCPESSFILLALSHAVVSRSLEQAKKKPPPHPRVNKHQRENRPLPKELTCHLCLNLVGFVFLL